MQITVDELKEGSSYSRNDLAKIWGYKDSTPLRRGIVANNNDMKIILFITENKHETQPQYIDYFDGETLEIDGENGHQNDRRLIVTSKTQYGDKIYLFYRKHYKEDFIYYGEVILDSYIENKDKPSKFTFKKKSKDKKNYNFYNEEMPELKPIAVEKNGITYFPTDSNKKEKAKSKSNYLCEYNNEHLTFISASSNKNFVEGHHLIPMSYQNEFKNSIDVISNIVTLCPNCHRAIHHSKEKEKLIEKLYNLRKDKLIKQGIEIDFDYLMNMYDKQGE